MRPSLTPNKSDISRRFVVHKRRRTGWDSNDRRIAHAHSDKIVDSDLFYNFTAYDYDGSQLIMERKWDCHIACYAYGPFGPISRTKLDGDAPCVRWLLSDGRGTTSGAADDAGNIQIQHYDAFGVPLETAVVSTCPRPNCAICQRGQRTTGELGYHGQEGYKTPMYDARRYAPLPNADPNHPEHDTNYPDGYETPSRGLMQVGARDYDPYAGRFLQPDPERTGPELNAGLLNRWTYCANDPVNYSDPTGRVLGAVIALVAIALFIAGLLFLLYDAYSPVGCRSIVFSLTNPSTWTWQFKLGVTLLLASFGLAAIFLGGPLVAGWLVGQVTAAAVGAAITAAAGFFIWLWSSNSPSADHKHKRLPESPKPTIMDRARYFARVNIRNVGAVA